MRVVLVRLVAAPLRRAASLSLMLWLSPSIFGAGCAQNPLPAALTPAAQSCGNPCASLTCPSAYTCSIDAHCGAHCEPERVGDKPF